MNAQEIMYRLRRRDTNEPFFRRLSFHLLLDYLFTFSNLLNLLYFYPSSSSSCFSYSFRNFLKGEQRAWVRGTIWLVKTKSNRIKNVRPNDWVYCVDTDIRVMKLQKRNDNNKSRIKCSRFDFKWVGVRMKAYQCL